MHFYYIDKILMVISTIITIQTMFYTLRHCGQNWRSTGRSRKMVRRFRIPVIPPDPKHRTPSPIVEVERKVAVCMLLFPTLRL